MELFSLSIQYFSSLLGAYPAITRWLGQARQLPGYVGMDDGAIT